MLLIGSITARLRQHETDRASRNKSTCRGRVHYFILYAQVVESADTSDSKSDTCKSVRVQVPPWAD